MSLDEPLAVKVERWRQAAAAGTLSIEDYKLALREIRAGRVSAAASAGSSRKKSSKTPVDVDSMMSEIDDIPG